MISKLQLSILVFGLALVAYAQGQEEMASVEIRVVLHDPVNPVAELYYMKQDGQGARLNLRPQALSRPFVTMPVNGSLVLFEKAEIDPENPSASMAASAKLPAGIKRAIVVVVPAPEGVKPAYRMLVIDDSSKAFPGGESLVLPLINANVVVQAGEHTLPVHPGKLTKVPFVKEVNDFNMAQTNFHYQQDGSWVTFAERQLQYLEACRRLFIIHFTPGALQPTVTTVVDTNMG